MLPSASTTLNTARVEPSGDRPRYAVPTAPRLRAPGSSCVGRRGVRLPANTPPACKFGAPASGAPSGSRIVDVPIPCKPLGALAGQRRPKALLIEIPSGLLTPVKPADAAVLQLCRSGLICWASLRHRFVVCSSGGNSNRKSSFWRLVGICVFLVLPARRGVARRARPPRRSRHGVEAGPAVSESRGQEVSLDRTVFQRYRRGGVCCHSPPRRPRARPKANRETIYSWSTNPVLFARKVFGM